MVFGFAPLFRAPTAMATGTTAMNTRTAIKIKTKRSSLPLSDEEGDYAKETEDKPEGQKLELAGDRRDLLVQFADETLRSANESVRNAEADVKKWNEQVEENLPFEMFFEVCTAEHDKANERLKEGNECLKEARDFYLQLTQPARQVADSGETVASKIQNLEAWDVLVPENEYEPLTKETALTFDLQRYQADEWINTEAVRFVTDSPLSILFEKSRSIFLVY